MLILTMPRTGTIRTLLAIGLLVVAGIMVFWLALSPPAGDPIEFHAASDSAPFGLFAPGTLDEIPPEHGQVMIDALGLSTIADYQDFTIGLVKELGVTWVRIDFLYDGSDFFVPADYLSKLQANGIEVVGCPRSFVDLGPEDMPAYEAGLQKLVAGHPEIRTWQIDNEPSIDASGPDSHLPVFFSGQRVVREVCPGCRVALAGVPALDPGRQESLDYFDGLLAEIARSHKGVRPPFDIFDIHFYGFAGDSEVLQSVVRQYEELLKKHGLGDGVSIWMSECATYTGKPVFPEGLEEQTEEEQAAELVKRFVTALGGGVERVAWARFYENYNYRGISDNYFDNSGIVYNGLGAEASRGVAPGTRKAAFFAYRELISRLDGYAGVSLIAPGQYRFDFGDGAEPVYVAWSSGDSRLSPELEGDVTVTGLDGTSYETDRLTLGEAPVFVNKR